MRPVLNLLITVSFFLDVELCKLAVFSSTFFVLFFVYEFVDTWNDVLIGARHHFFLPS